MVLYFSGTGNSRYVARKIAELSGDDVISINERLKNRELQSDYIGEALGLRRPRLCRQIAARDERLYSKS